MPLTGTSTPKGIPNFSAADRPDLAGSKGPGLPDITAKIDALLGLVPLWDSTDAGISFPTASIPTPTLPQTFKHLRLVLSLKTDIAAQDVNTYLRCNNDATAGHHLYQYLQAGGTVVTAGDNNTTNTAWYIGNAAGTASQANTRGAFVVDLPDYAAVECHSFVGQNWHGGDGTTGGLSLGFFGGTHEVAQAITTLQVLLLGGGNFVAGSRVTVYGAA